MTFDQALRALNEAAYLAAHLARTEPGAPAADLRKIALDTDCLIDHGCTYDAIKARMMPTQARAR